MTIRRPPATATEYDTMRETTVAVGTSSGASSGISTDYTGRKERRPRGAPISCGGPEGIRTPDLFIANEARYQLRHRPENLRYIITLGRALRIDGRGWRP